jgi:hypothetical protein
MASYNEMLTELTVNRRAQRHFMQKQPASTLVGYQGMTFWQGAGNPGVGSLPAIGKTNGRVCTSATAGALPLKTPPSGKKNILRGLSLSTTRSGGLGQFYVLDRLADIQLAANEATGALTGFDATSKLGASSGWGDGCLLIGEVSSTLSGTSNTHTFSYTNELGVAGRSTAVVISALATTVGNSVNNTFFFCGHQGNDRGIRSVESLTLTGTATGSVVYSLVKIVAEVSMSVAGYVHERDFIYDLPSAQPLRDDACLFLAFVGQGALDPVGPVVVDLNIVPVTP